MVFRGNLTCIVVLLVFQDWHDSDLWGYQGNGIRGKKKS